MAGFRTLYVGWEIAKREKGTEDKTLKKILD